MAAEGYLLGDLSETERNAFEEHYIDCPVCAETVWTGTAMFAAGPEAVRDEQKLISRVAKVLPFRRRVQQSLSFAAAAAIAFVLGGVSFPPPAPAMMELVSLGGAIAGVMRGPADDLEIHFDGKHRMEVLIYGVDAGYRRYFVELRDASGKVLKALDLTPQQAQSGDGTSVLLRPLPAGRYVLAIVGVRKEGNRLDLAERNIVVR